MIFNLHMLVLAYILLVSEITVLVTLLKRLQPFLRLYSLNIKGFVELVHERLKGHRTD